MTCSICGDTRAITLEVTVRVMPKKSHTHRECVACYLEAEKRGSIATAALSTPPPRLRITAFPTADLFPAESE